MTATIKDVAQLAKVSIASVSKALNGEKGVGSSTRERIMNAAKILGYAPNARAVSFSKKECHAILFVYRSFPDDPFTNPYVYSLFEAILESLTDQHYSLSAINVVNLANPTSEIVEQMRRKAYDGVIVHPNALSKELLSEMRLNRFPSILIGRDDYVNWVDTNHVLAGKAAASYLYNRGYRRLAFIGGGKGDEISSLRLEGLRQGAEEYGIGLEESRVSNVEPSLFAVGEAVKGFLRETARPDVIVTSNNTILFEASRVLETMKVKVPDEISYITFDSYPYAGLTNPPSTSIVINVRELGHEVAHQMIKIIKNRSYSIQSYVTVPTVKVGESTK